jgi:hypothetical protein
MGTTTSEHDYPRLTRNTDDIIASVFDLDLRGDGGCVVAPPSIHSSGKAYTWVSGCEPGKVALAKLQ